MRRLLAIAALGVIMLIAMVVVAIVLLSSPGDLGTSGFLVILFAALWLYWGLGAVIVVRADGHAVGWLFAVAAALMATVFSCIVLGWALSSSQPPHPLGAWLSLAGSLLFPPAIILTLPAVALTFPTGSLPGPRWRWPVGLVAAMVVVGTLATVIRPGPMAGPLDDAGWDNPLTPWLPAVSPGMLEVLGALAAIGSLSLPLGTGLGVAATIVRFRRSQDDQRQQLKWFLAAMAPASVLITMSISGVLSSLPVIDLLTVVTLPIVAVSVAIAILRYRLYDIDRIISRTIGYALITGTLAATLVALILVLGGLLARFAEGETIAVAASTLAAFALLQPVRRRVQRAVDRRFDRATFDAELTIAGFAGRLRVEHDLESVRAEIVDTTATSVRPTTAAVWIRNTSR